MSKGVKRQADKPLTHLHAMELASKLHAVFPELACGVVGGSGGNWVVRVQGPLNHDAVTLLLRTSGEVAKFRRLAEQVSAPVRAAALTDPDLDQVTLTLEQ